MIPKVVSRVASIGFGCLFMAATVRAQVPGAQTLYATGFEASEAFALGAIAGQNNWFSVGDGSTLTGTIGTVDAISGRSLAVDAAVVTDASFWYRPLSYNTASSQRKIVRVSWQQRMMTPPDPPSFETASVFGVLAYDPVGSFLNGIFLDNFDRSVNYYSFAQQNWQAVPNATFARGQVESLAFELNFEDGSVRYFQNGNLLPVNSRMVTNSAIFGDADIYVGFARLDRSIFDNLLVESIPVGRISGKLTLDRYDGPMSERHALIELRNPSTDALVEGPISADLAPDGAFLATVLSRGVYDVVIRSETHLKRRIGSAAINGFGQTGIELTLLNGDIDGDNSVSILDYLALSTAFEKSSSDSDWLTVDGGSGLAPKDSDLDGDEQVSILDYIILSSNYDLSGE